MRRCIVLEQHYLQRRIKLSVFFFLEIFAQLEIHKFQ